MKRTADFWRASARLAQQPSLHACHEAVARVSSARADTLPFAPARAPRAVGGAPSEPLVQRPGVPPACALPLPACAVPTRARVLPSYFLICPGIHVAGP